MRRFHPAGVAAVIASLALSVGAARAAIVVSSDGSDGAFSPAGNIEIDLSKAVTGTWNASNAANAGKGIYDASKWAVVFKYTNVTIPAGVTVTFKNHPTHAPVVWLVSGSVNIAGSINLDGKTPANNGTPAEPGPGGFRGGVGGGQAVSWSGGFGPGGGTRQAASGPGAGSYTATGTGSQSWTYGDPGLLPLLGGSGSAGDDQLRDGGGGGGAILIACANTVTIAGSIQARGAVAAKGGGAGGGIRIVADKLAGAGTLSATGGAAGGWTGSVGRIRLEANQTTMTGTATPPSSVGIPIVGNPDIFPPANAPRIAITQIAGINAPTDPKAALTSPGQDVAVAITSSTKVRLQANNVPLNWRIYVRIIPKTGGDSYAAATLLSGDANASVWEATTTLPPGLAAIEALASAP
jgi:hypothetical protein